MVDLNGRASERIPLGVLVQEMERAGAPPEVIEKVVVATEPNLITLKHAAEKYGIALESLRNWLYRANITERARESFPARGGGKVLIDENELIAYLERRNPKGGRPQKH